MDVPIDKAGRIVVPQSIRDRLGFSPDTELSVTEQPEGVLITRATQRSSMVCEDGLWVHQGRAEPNARWAHVIRDVRDERLDSLARSDGSPNA